MSEACCWLWASFAGLCSSQVWKQSPAQTQVLLLHYPSQHVEGEWVSLFPLLREAVVPLGPGEEIPGDKWSRKMKSYRMVSP